MKLVIQNSARVWGGNEKWMLSVAEGLRARGHEVVVACRAGGPVARRLEARGVPVSPARSGALPGIPRALAFARWLSRERPDAVLLTSWRATFWGAWAARRAGVPRVVVRLGIVRAPEGWSVRFAFRRWVDAMIVNADEIRAAWRGAAPWFAQGRIHVVMNGVEPPEAGRSQAAERLRGELRAGAGDWIVCGAGALTRRKGFDLLLEAFARAGVPGSRLVVAGDGPEGEALRRRAEALGVAERTHWLGRRDDVPRILAESDLFVLASRNEGMANVMLEAMAAGTPVVATEVSGVRAALGPGDDGAAAGWIVPPEDPAALAAALREAAGDAHAALARAGHALRRVEARFGMARMVDEVEAVLLGRPADPRPETGAGAVA